MIQKVKNKSDNDISIDIDLADAVHEIPGRVWDDMVISLSLPVQHESHMQAFVDGTIIQSYVSGFARGILYNNRKIDPRYVETLKYAAQYFLQKAIIVCDIDGQYWLSTKPNYNVDREKLISEARSRHVTMLYPGDKEKVPDKDELFEELMDEYCGLPLGCDKIDWL